MAKEVHKLQQLNVGDTNPHVQQLRQNYVELATAHNNLVDAFNKNFNIWNGVIANMDERVGALTLLGEVLGAAAQLPPLEYYLQQYKKAVAEEAAKIQAAQAALGVDSGEFQKVPVLVPPEPLITPVVEEPEDTDEVDSDFGGDLEHAQT